MSVIKSSQPDLYAKGIFPAMGFTVTQTGLDKFIDQSFKPVSLTGPVNFTDIQTAVNNQMPAPQEGPQKPIEPAQNNQSMTNTPTLLEGLKPEDIFVSPTQQLPIDSAVATGVNQKTATQETAKKRSPWPFIIGLIIVVLLIWFFFFRK